MQKILTFLWPLMPLPSLPEMFVLQYISLDIELSLIEAWSSTLDYGVALSVFLQRMHF